MKKLGKLQEARGRWSPTPHSLRIASRVSSALHRASARAVLKRTGFEAPRVPDLAVLEEPWEAR